MLRLFLIFCIAYCSVSAQSEATLSVDELKAVWNNKDNHDTTRVRALCKYANKFVVSSDEYKSSAKLAYQLHDQVKSPKYRALALELGAFSLSIDSSISAFEECRDIYIELNLPMEIASMELYIGNEWRRKNNYIKALHYFDLALTRYQKLNNHKGEASVLQSIAAIHSALDDQKKYTKYMQMSIAQLQLLGDIDKVSRLYGAISWNFRERDMIDSAKYFLEKSNKGFLTLKDTMAMIPNLIALSQIQYDAGNFVVSLSYIDSAINLIPPSDTFQIALQQYDKAEPLMAMGRYEEAFYAINWSLKELLKRNSFGPASAAYGLLGVVHLHKGDVNNALTSLKKSLELSTKSSGNYGVAESAFYIGKNLFEYDLPQHAIDYFIKSIEASQKIGVQHYALKAWEYLYKSYEATNDMDKAYHAHKNYVHLKDSTNSEINVKALLRQEYQYAYDKQAAADSIRNSEHSKVKDAEIARQDAELDAQKSERLLLYGGISLILLFAFFVVNRLRVTRKQKQLITEQKLAVEEQKEVVELAHMELEYKNKEIMDSINYAKRIQSAILPPRKIVKEYLPESFISYKPKDVVAGDFYWMEPTEDGVLFAACDCTGHGVPGAMVSVICNNGLNRSVREYGLNKPGQILDKTREIVIEEFEKSEEEVKDGMDIALCSLSIATRTLSFAGANNPLWIVRKGVEDVEGLKKNLPMASKIEAVDNYTFMEIKADKQPIGKYDEPKPYTTHTIELNKGDSFYIFSDGYADQFGGNRGKKFKASNFKNLLISIQNETMIRQHEIIDEAFENWKGELEQLDDVCVIGVRV